MKQMNKQQVQARIILRKISALVTKGWCKKSDAKDKNGEEICPLSRKAVAFSIWGAQIRATNAFDAKTRRLVQQALWIATPSGSAKGYNNRRNTKKDNILNLVKRAYDYIGTTQQVDDSRYANSGKNVVECAR